MADTLVQDGKHAAPLFGVCVLCHLLVHNGARAGRLPSVAAMQTAGHALLFQDHGLVLWEPKVQTSSLSGRSMQLQHWRCQARDLPVLTPRATAS